MNLSNALLPLLVALSADTAVTSQESSLIRGRRELTPGIECSGSDTISLLSSIAYERQVRYCSTQVGIKVCSSWDDAADADNWPFCVSIPGTGNTCTGELDENNMNDWCAEQVLRVCMDGEPVETVTSEDAFVNTIKGSFVPAENGFEARLKRVSGTLVEGQGCMGRIGLGSCTTLVQGRANSCNRGCTYGCS